MKYIAAIVLLALALGLAQGVPLQGGNENVTAVLFNAIKLPSAENQNETILELDLSLLGTDDAKFELIDSKDNVYSPVFYGNLERGRQLLYFKIPEYALFKLFRVTPPEGGPININWWETPKKTKDDLVLRYYGLIDWMNGAPNNPQGVVYQVSLFNQSSPLPVALDNFTLLDQWRWPYIPTNIETLENYRINLIFENLSPLSKPMFLVYDYTGPNEIFIDLENDPKPLPDSKVYGGNGTTSQPSAPPVTEGPKAIVTPPSQTTPKASSLKEEIAATKNRLQNVTSSSTGSGSSSGSPSLTSGIEEAKMRLERMKRNP
jgi:hypothetical protein